MIGLGVITYNRPSMAEKCLKAIRKHVLPYVKVYIHDDASDAKYHGAYARAFNAVPGAWIHAAETNGGVSVAKNRLLRQMLDDGADWCFLIEDDIRVTSPDAISRYLRACYESDSHHLSFAHHGPANIGGPVETQGEVQFYPHSIGAFCIYSRECLEKVGLFDESLVNAWEHVEHTMRVINAGLCPGAGPYRFPDATGSAEWLEELPNAIERSAIRLRPDWQTSIVDGLKHWQTTQPDTWAQMFGPGSPLERWAADLLA